uniref:coiled-coil domain-containing protein 78 n=1 Tax=Jaculus jaculus TaxID=51337 RepID=UPI001E1B3EC4|nr:coiled-coil domain-containing protein 78 [Jaculus jaculus]
MECAAAPGPKRGASLQAVENIVPGAGDWLPGVAGNPTWPTSLETGLPLDLELSEEQQLQISKELVDLQIATHCLHEQHEAEVFELKREVFQLESRVLKLELHGDDASQENRIQAKTHQGYRRAPVQKYSGEAQGPEYADHSRLQVQRRDALSPEPEQLKPGSNLPGGQQQLQREMKWVQEHHGARQQALETRIAALGQQLQGAQEEARAARQQLAVQTMVLSTCQGQLRQAEAENAQLQLQLKRLSEECAMRLRRRAQEMVESTGGTSQAALRKFLETTVQDIRAAHHSREQQLAQAARAYRKRLADLSQRQELLLSTCRALDSASWTQIQQKLQDFSHSTQAELERERAQLLIRATMAEQQVSELQDYVNQHLGRYKQEILKLRKVVGAENLCKVEAMPPTKPQCPRTCSR